MSDALFEEHHSYLADPIRHEKLQSALATIVRKDHRVVDLGCGTGVLGLLCLQNGAAFVDAIEQTAMIAVAGESFRRAGFGPQVRLHQESSFRTVLEQRADLLVCDHVGYFGVDYGLLDLLADARERMLKPDGVILPRRLRVYVGLVGSDACRSKAEAWATREVAPEFHWLRKYSINSKHAVEVKPNELLSNLVQIADFELGVAYPSQLSWRTELVATRNGILDGLVGCFDAELAEGISMSNSPLAKDPIRRRQAFLPIDSRLPIKKGDRLIATIRQVPSENLVAWQLEHLESEQRFSHSTFAGRLFTPNELRRKQPNYCPKLGERGRARNSILAYADGTRTISEIQEAVLRDHPSLLPSQNEIRRFVSATLRRETE